LERAPALEAAVTGASLVWPRSTLGGGAVAPEAAEETYSPVRSGAAGGGFGLAAGRGFAGTGWEAFEAGAALV
jgi:hypothetical protein